MIGTSNGDSVEGLQLDIITRKINPVRPARNKPLGKVVYGFRLQMASRCTITRELNPKKHKINRLSMLTKDDEIRGERIVGFSQKAFRKEVIGGATGTHKAIAIIARKFGFAEIEIALRAHLQKKLKLSPPK